MSGLIDRRLMKSESGVFRLTAQKTTARLMKSWSRLDGGSGCELSVYPSPDRKAGVAHASLFNYSTHG